MIKRGYVIEVNFGERLTGVQGGIRPCIVVANNLCNKYSPAIHVVPLTSKLNKKRMITHIFIKKDMFNNLKYDSLILTEQVTLISTKQIIGYIGRASGEIMEQVDSKLIIQLALDSNSRPSNILNINKPDVKRIKRMAEAIKELESYIISQKYQKIDLLNSLNLQINNFKDYCTEYNIDYSKYYISKIKEINNYLNKTAA
ncbi:type II toxin-antitoxin system PemK/MazF family toxin [Clostridium rectalis]|uniref:type II toxin-antitoxin system PemK/MazF family toxin n=1 Tax=Clostridium rectalis TaxID=2040295 RepID=UPI000F638E3C|nr:type II toxin-antitoxin system PemK/MazF family toxin [Clostridium rectalis]